MFPQLISNLLSPPPHLRPPSAGVVKDCHYAWLLYLSSWCLSSPLLVTLSQSMTGVLFAGHMDAFCLRYASLHLSGSWEYACARNLLIKSFFPSLLPLLLSSLPSSLPSFNATSLLDHLQSPRTMITLSHPYLLSSLVIILIMLAHSLACSPAHSIPPSKFDLLLCLPFAITT